MSDGSYRRANSTHDRRWIIRLRDVDDTPVRYVDNTPVWYCLDRWGRWGFDDSLPSGPHK